MCFLALSLWIYFAYYRMQRKADKNYSLDDSVFSIHAKVMRTLPSTGYSLLIALMNLIYRKIATYLNDYGKNKI